MFRYKLISPIQIECSITCISPLQKKRMLEWSSGAFLLLPFSDIAELILLKNTLSKIHLKIHFNQEYSFQITMRQQWNDKRLAYKERLQGQLAGLSVFSIWRIIKQQKQECEAALTPQYQALFLVFVFLSFCFYIFWYFCLFVTRNKYKYKLHIELQIWNMNTNTKDEYKYERLKDLGPLLTH